MAICDKGIDIRQDNSQLLIRVALTDSDGAIVTSGTSTVYIYEVQDDGSLYGYDFTSHTFSDTPTNDEDTLSHQVVNGVNSGIWTKAITDIDDFSDNGIYIIRVTNTNAVPDEQFREFQWSGGALADVKQFNGNAATGSNIADRFVEFFEQASSTFNVATALSDFKAANGLEVDLTKILGTALDEDTEGWIAAAFKYFLNVETPALDVSDAMVGTDNANTTTPPTVANILDGVITELDTLPDAEPKLKEAIAFLYMRLRNKVEETATKQTIYADDAETAEFEATMNDNGTTFTKGEFGNA